ncbi:MAG: PQQ-binding-like beta-propeller repeat protein [Verrucomicrobiota bacterium]
MKNIFLMILLFGLITQAAVADNWPRFRGSNGSGVSEGVTIPTEWSEADFRWKIDLPGVGHGSPVVWGERVFLLAASEPPPRPKKKKGKKKKALVEKKVAAVKPQNWLPMCVSSKDGSILWKQEIIVEDAKYKGHRFNSPASTTPAVDDKRVVFTWGTPEKLTMAAFSHDGKKLWQSDLGPVSGGHGFAASPILLQDLVVLNNDQEKGGGNLIALDANTGKVKWTVERRSQRLSYSVPCVMESEGRKLLVFVNWQHGFTVIDAKDGRVVAEKSVFNTDVNERAISSPVVYKDLIIGTCGFTANPKHCVAMRLKGDQLEEVWRIERNVPHIPSLIVVGDLAYLWDDAGIVTCVKAATGEQVWKARVPGVEGSCFGSPVSDGKSIFSADESGNINVIAVADELKHLATNRLGELCRTTPAIADGAMFVRTYKKLIAVEGK